MHLCIFVAMENSDPQEVCQHFMNEDKQPSFQPDHHDFSSNGFHSKISFEPSKENVIHLLMVSCKVFAG